MDITDSFGVSSRPISFNMIKFISKSKIWNGVSVGSRKYYICGLLNKDVHNREKTIIFSSSEPEGSEIGENEMKLVKADSDSISEELLSQMETNSPGEWEIMKELLGINIFTYILAALIVVFLSLNALLGPGWLGQSMGIKGTGSFTEISNSLPDSVDLSNPENLL